MSNNLGSRNMPVNELDMEFMITDPAWGKEVTDQLFDQLSKKEEEIKTGCADPDCRAEWSEEDTVCPKCGGSESAEYVKKKSLWGLLAYYTRDLRLGNLSSYKGEMDYCRHYLSLAGDCLRHNYPQAFMASLSRVIDMIELSQSKGGFVRKLKNTIFQNISRSSDLEPSRKKLVGNAKKD